MPVGRARSPSAHSRSQAGRNTSNQATGAPSPSGAERNLPPEERIDHGHQRTGPEPREDLSGPLDLRSRFVRQARSAQAAAVPEKGLAVLGRPPEILQAGGGLLVESTGCFELAPSLIQRRPGHGQRHAVSGKAVGELREEIVPEVQLPGLAADADEV